MTDFEVNQQVSPRAYAVLKESREWGSAANATTGGVQLSDAIVKLHELLDKTIVALAQVEASIAAS